MPHQRSFRFGATTPRRTAAGDVEKVSGGTMRPIVGATRAGAPLSTYRRASFRPGSVQTPRVCAVLVTSSVARFATVGCRSADYQKNSSMILSSIKKSDSHGATRQQRFQRRAVPHLIPFRFAAKRGFLLWLASPMVGFGQDALITSAPTPDWPRPLIPIGQGFLFGLPRLVKTAFGSAIVFETRTSSDLSDPRVCRSHGSFS
jgi:hypothetical protein